MILNKIATSLCLLIPLSSFAEYRVHLPLTEEFRGNLPDNSIVFVDTNHGGGNNGNENGGEDGGSSPPVDNPILTTDSSGNSCAYNDNNYVAEERTINGYLYEYMYEWKSTHFSVPIFRGNSSNSVLYYNGKSYDLSGSEQKVVNTGSDQTAKQVKYYKICEQTNDPD